MAAAMPNNPTPEDKKAVEDFLNSISKIYPCKICSKHFKEMLQENPIKYNTREELVFYLCGLHNNVNERLGKPIYECHQAFEIWGGDCGCEVEEN